MNHIYKSIFNKALGVFTAVPEFASAHGKGSERTVVGRVAKGTAGFAASALAISIGLALTSTSAVAYPGIYINDRQAGNCLAINDTAVANLGVGTILDVNSTPGSVELKVPGTYSPQTGITPSYYNAAGSARPCVAVGGSTVDNRDTQTNRTLFYGGPGAATEADEVNNENNGAKNLTLGGRLDVNSGIIGVGDRGTNGAGATNSIRMGTGTTLDEANKKINSIAIGVNTQATSHYATAIGEEALANGSDGALAIGRKATANATSGPMAIGYDAVTTGKSGIAQGYHAHTNAQSGLAIGDNAKASGIGQVAIGYASNAQKPDIDKTNTAAPNKADYSVTVGHYAGADYTGTNNIRSTLVGDSAGRYGEEGNQNTAVGSLAGMYVKGSNNVALGIGTGSGSAAEKLEVNSTVAIGNNAKALTNDSVAIGTTAKSGKVDKFSGERSVAIGAYSEALGTGGIAIGDSAATTNGHNGVAIGVYSKTQNEKAISIGAFNKATGAQSIVIAGNYDLKNSDGVSVASGTRATVIGAETTVSGNNSVAIGDTNTVASARTYALGNNINAAAGTDDSLAFGTRASVQGANTIAVGNTAQALTDDSITIGRDSKAGKVDKFDGKKSIAIGYASEAMGSNAIALGSNSATNNGHDAIAMGTYAKTNGEKTISIGAYNTAEGAQSIVIAGNYDASTGSNRSTTTAAAKRAIVVGPESHATAEDALAIGNKNTVASARTYAIGNNINVAAGADDSLAFGTKASVAGVNTIAMGNTTQASANYAIAVGNTAQASGEHATAIGNKSVASNVSAIALGRQAQATNENAVALGADSKADGHSSFAGAVGASSAGTRQVSIGHYAGNNTQGSSTPAKPADHAVFIGNYAGSDAAGTNGNTNGVAIGSEAGRYLQSGSNNTAIGSQAGQYVEGSLNASLGQGAGKYVKGDKNIAIGTNAAKATETDKTIASNTIAMGTESEVSKDNAIAIGTMAKSRNFSSVALGPNSDAAGASAIAVGNESSAIGQSSVATGFRAKADGYEQVSIGSSAGARSTTISNYAVSIGAHAGADNASTTGNSFGIAIGANAGQHIKSGVRSLAIGQNAGQYVDGDNNAAIGVNAGRKVKGVGNAAYGDNAGSNLVGDNNIAIGRNANSVADGSTLTVSNTIALGPAAKAENHSNVAIGNSAAATAENAMALGANTKAGTANSVALGRYSETSDIHTGDYTLNGSYTAAGLPKAENGTVSVGSAGKERQIQNVAAGVISATSTDAINGSQLYATNNYLSNLAGGVKNVLGGDAAVDNAGNVTMSNIGGTGKGNVNDAIAAANTKVAAGENITVTPTDNADGSKTYTVATKKDLVVDSVKAGDTTVNTDGVTITGGPSVKKDGINAGDKKITGVADGNVAAGSKDAVNGGQLAEVKAKADSAVQNVVSANPTALTATKAGDTVTLTPNFIAGDLVNADGTVNDPAATDEGKLVSAKTVADALKANHFVVDTKANGGTVDTASEENAKVGSGNKVTFEAGKNLVAQQTNTANGGATVNYKLSDTLENLVSVKSAEIEAGIGPNKVVLNNNGVKVGDSTLNDKGLTINNGPSVTDAGINAGNKKITGVANGDVSTGSTDAVNGGQLAEVKAKADTAVQDVKSGDENALTAEKDPNTNIVTVTPKLSGDLVDANGNITAPATPADKGKLVTAGTVAEALANTHFVVDTKATDGELDAASQADQKIKASNKVTLQAGKNLKAKQTNGANGAEVEFSLKDSISLKEVKVGEGSANEVVLNNNGVNVAGNTYINKDGLNANDKKITNVAPGAVTAASKDAVNGSQLYNVANNVKDLIGPDAAIDPATGKVTVADPAKGIGETGKGNIGDAIKHVNDAAKAAAETAAKHTTVVEGKNVKVTKGKNAAGGDEYTVATKDDLDVTSVTAGNTTVNTNGLTITGGPSVTRGGIDAGNRVISGVKAGDVSATSQEAVNGSQLHATNTKLDGVKAKADTAVQDVKSGDDNALTAVKDPNTNIVTVTPKLSGDLVDANGNITAPTTPADKGKLVTAGTVADALANTHFVVDTKATDGELDAASQADQKIKAGNKVTLQAGKNLKAKQTNGANGAQVEFSLKDSISLKEVTAGEGANQVVLNDKGVNVGGNTYINNDGLNANGNKITNVADGVDPKDAVNKGQLDAVKGVADSAVKSVDVANGEQNLVVDNTDPKNPKLSLKKDLTVDSVKAGDSTLNNDGLTIAGGPSVKKDGINAGDKTITNVAPGAVTPTSKDAVNGGQLYNVANNVKDLIGPDATIDPATGKVTVADPAKGIGETGKGNIGDAIKHVNDLAKNAADTAKKHTTVEQGDNIVVEESTNAEGGKHYKVSTAKNLNVDSVKAGDTTVNNDGVTIAGGPSVTKGGINAGGNTITNVADGVNPNDAVNKGQLDAVKGVADSAVKSVDVANGEQNLVVDNSDPKNPKLSLKKDLTVDSVKAGDSTLNNDGLTIAGGPSVKKDGIDAGDKKITNVAAGDVAENSKDAVNGGQLHNVAKGVADVLGGDAAVDGNGKVTMTNIGETGKGNVNDAIKHVNDLAKNAADTAKKHTTVEQGDNIVVEESTNADGGKHYKVSTAKNLNVDSVKAGDTTVNNNGVTINNGPSMTKDGINANNTKVTNVADGVDAADAVNKGQLDKVDTKVSNVAQNVVNVLGGDATVNGNGDITMSNIGETGKGNINDAIKSVNDLAKKAAAEKTSVKAKEGRSNVTVTEGVNAAGGHEYTVDVERSVTNAGSDYVTVTNNHDADSNTTTYTVDVSAKTKASLAKADSAVQGLTSKDGNLNFTKGANGNVEVSFNDNLNVKNVTTDRVQVANGPSMSKDGINAAGKAISNVANGNVAADSKDAVNGGQLHETAKSVADVIGGGATVKDGKVVAGQNGIGNTGQNTVHGAIAAINQNTANNFNQIRGDLRKMDRDLRGGIAGALATAGLPQAFRPGKSMVAAAASTYRGQSGLAIGVSRISDNGKVILKVTGNTNSRGDFGGTIGAGYQW